MAYLEDINNVTKLSSINEYNVLSGPQNDSLATRALGTVTAAVVDVGTTIWNSLIPESTGYEIETRDALQKIGYQGALQAYDENREVVDALSFIGGVFIPGGAALKLTRAIRAGIRGTNWLSQTRHFEDLQRIERLVKDGAEASREFKYAKASVFLRGQANNAIDFAASEAAIIATFNEHPYMQDYLKNPLENFAISFAVGGAIGGGVAAILNKSEISKIVGTAQTSAVNEVVDASKLYSSFVADNATSALSTKFAIDNLDELSIKENVSNLSKQIANNWKINLQAKLGEIENDTFSKGILELDPKKVDRSSITNLIQDKRFIGVEKIDFYNVNTPVKTKNLFAEAKILLGRDSALEVKTSNKIIFDPKHNAFISEAAAQQLGTAADLNIDLDNLARLGKKQPLADINLKGFRDDVFFNSSAEVDKRYISDFLRFQDVDSKGFTMANVASNDISKLNGIVYGYRAAVARNQAILTSTESTAKQITQASKELDALANTRIKIFEPNSSKPRESLVAVLDDDLVNAKSAVLRQFQANGVATEVAAIKTNTPFEVVEAFYNSDANRLSELGFNDITQMTKYNSRETIELSLRPTNKLLQAEYKNVFSDLSQKQLKDTRDPKVQYRIQLNNIMRKQQESVQELANAKLYLTEVKGLTPEEKLIINNSADVETLATQRYEAAVTKYEEAMLSAQDDFIDSTLLQYDNLELARNLRNDVVNNYTTSILREGIGQFVNAKGGNRFLNSADFVTRNMEEAGRIATEIGDAKVEAANRVFRRLITPVTSGMREIANKPELMTELGTALNVRASTKGKLIYKEGQFVTEVKQADGTIDEVAAFIPGTDKIYATTSREVDEILSNLQFAGREIYEQQKVVNQLKGIREPSDIGFWSPSFNPLNKHIGYVQDLNTGALKMFVGKTSDELTDVMNAYPRKKHERIMTRDEVEKYKISVHGDLLDDVSTPNAEIQKQGIGLVTPDISPQMLQDVVEGIRSRIQYQATAIVENSMPDIFQKLDLLSSFNQRATATQGSNAFQRAIKTAATRDTARDVKEIILGESSLKSNPFMSGVNNATNTVIQYGIDMTTKLFNNIKGSLGFDESFRYDEYMNSLKASGIDNPFEVFSNEAQAVQYARAQGKTDAITPSRLVNGSNAFAATIALRFGELSQPLVNILSLPILQISAISRTFKAEAIKNGTDVLANSPLSIMMNGVRRMNSMDPKNKKYLELFKNEGLLESRVSEVDDVIRQARFATGGIISKMEKLIDNKFVDFMSKPSDYSDHLTRKATLMTAVELANKIYGPTISDQRMLIFARDFLKQTIGNYSAAQRPTLFQGTAGAAMGLFQTYMLTYAQSMYRSIELQDFKGLGKMMLAQGGIFGAGSLPGFHPISELIGENFSDDHVDLFSGTYRALPDPVANILMYGLPSNLAPAIHTRGDVNPRLPTGFSTLVAPSMISQTMDTLTNVGKAIFDQNKPTGQAFLEALSMQSVSRPIARWSELISGRSVTQAGGQIAGPAEVWSWQGSLARVFGTRPLAEAKIREFTHLNTVYGADDQNTRRKLSASLKQLIRAGALDEDALESVAVEYLRTGSPQGFRSTVQEAMLNSSREGYADVAAKLGDSPLMYMLEDIE